MEQFPDLASEMPEIPDEFDDRAGLIVPDPTQPVDPIDQYAYPIADDILYNILYSLVLPVHRTERISRSLTAGIVVTQLARDKCPPTRPSSCPPTAPNSPTSAPSTPKKRRHYPQHIETEAAVWDDGIVTIKGNPLVKVREIRCPKCGLEKLLHPTTGNGAREAPQVEGKEYCCLEPHVEREGYDIYGLPFPKDDVSNSKKKDRAPEKVGRNGLGVDGADSSFESSAVGDSPPPGGIPEERREKEERKMVFPNVECPRCPRMVNVRVFARHLNGHLRSGGRASGRAAAARISGGDGEKREREKSRNVTPAAVKEEKDEKKPERSPRKRDREMDANDEYRPAKRTSLPDSTSSRSEVSSKSSSSSARPTTGGKGNLFGPALTRRELEEREQRERTQKSLQSKEQSKREKERQKEKEEKEERDKERRRIMQREMDKQREREIATNKLFMAAKRRWPDRVVKKWKSGKVTVDGRVWEGDRR